MIRKFFSRYGVALFVAALSFGLNLAFPGHAIAQGVALLSVIGATTTTSSLDSAMKVMYSDPIITDIVNSSEIIDLFRTDSNVQTEQFGGKYVEMAHYLRLAGAAQFRAENDYIPVPQNPRFANSRIYLKKILGVIEMTGDVMERVRGDEGAFIDFMDRALPDVKERVLTEMNRAAIGYGAGIKARVASVNVGAGTIVVDRALGVTGYQDAWLQFQEGETIVFSATAAGAVLKNAGTTQAALVENIDEATNTLTLTADAALLAAIAANDYIFAGDAAGTASQNGGVDREMSGLLAGVDDGGILSTYNNIPRAGNRQWKARVFDASVAPYNGVLTEDLLTIIDAQMLSSSGAEIDALVMSPHAPIGYWKDLRTQRVINDPRNYTGGKGSLSIMLGDRTLPFRTARSLPPQVVFGLNLASWRRFTLGTWEWDDRTGSIWKQVSDAVGRKDAFYAYGKMYEQLACIYPRRNFRIEGLIRQFSY